MDFERKDPDEIFQSLKDKFHIRQPKSFNLAVFLIILFFLFTARNLVYTIQPYEIGVIQRFGKYVRKSGPGLHFKLPWIEKLNTVNVEGKFREEFGYRTLSAGVKTQYSSKSYDDEALMLTADLNVIDIAWSIQYRKIDPVKYLFNIRDQRKTIRDTSESVMRDVVGDYSFEELITERSNLQLNELAKEKMQEILDYYQSGIQVIVVEFQDVMPPDPVQPAFEMENKAEQEKQTMINQAKQVYNQKIPEAKGNALKIIQEAEGYAKEAVNKAQGDASRFEQILSAYQQAKDVTEKRIYLENLQSVFENTGKIIIVDPQVKGILPLLNLDNNE
ncbi:MAG: FtsH protease activity modulator HflK [Candidatus Omnitrophica bacterium]|nr:FtsH protease activity modulator HflK [Candidatus Omnitrophota bacterium]